jgi:hypothetical protein
MASEQYGGQQQTNEELKDKIQKLHVSVSDLFDISKPWVLVPNGSLLGFFDWVSVCVKSPAVGTASTNHLDLTFHGSKNYYLLLGHTLYVGARASQGWSLVIARDGIPIHDSVFGLHEFGMVEDQRSAAIRSDV